MAAGRFPRRPRQPAAPPPEIHEVHGRHQMDLAVDQHGCHGDFMVIFQA